MFKHRPLFDHWTSFRMFVSRQRRRFPFRVVRERRRRHCHFSVLGLWRHLIAIGVSLAGRCVLQVVKLKRTSPTQRSWHELWLLTGADCDLSDAIKPRTRHKSLLELRTAHGGEYKTTNIYLCILNCLHFIFILHFLCIDVGVAKTPCTKDAHRVTVQPPSTSSLLDTGHIANDALSSAATSKLSADFRFLSLVLVTLAYMLRNSYLRHWFNFIYAFKD